MSASTLKSPLTLESPSPQVSRIPSPYSPNSPMKTSDTTYRGDYASAYDYVMVLSVADDNGSLGFTTGGLKYVSKLSALGFDLYAYFSMNRTEIFLLIRIPSDKLRSFADENNFQMLLNEAVLQETAEKGNEEKGIAPIFIEHRPDIIPYRPYQYIYARYSRLVSEKLYSTETTYVSEDGNKSIFSPADRLKLTSMLIESRPPNGGENLKLRRYIREKRMLGCFALHDYEKLYEVSTQWLPFSVLPWDQPFDLMREYFGEKIALYFVFMGHYTYWLMAPAFIGFVLQIAIWAINDYSAPFLPFYALFMAMWSVFMLEFWKRKEKDFAIRWGTLNFEESEKDCSEFKGQSIKSFIQNGNMRYYPTSTRCINMSQSTVVVVALIAAVVGAVAGIYLMRKSLEHAVGSAAQSITSVVNVVQIQVMNFTYNFIVTELTNRENHRTETDYEDSMITKLFVFQFVNSYASFFYLAFFAQYFGAECGDDGCMTVLALNLAIVYGSRLVTGNLTELFIPYLSYKYRYNKEILTSSAEMSRPEKEFYLDTYDSRKSSLVDYAEVAIQFGYNALFATALPISSFFSLASNFVEIKGDAWKLVNIFQRPVPVAAEDIGSWQTIFLLLTVASVITNAALIVFTMNDLDGYSEQFRYWIFIGFQWVCFSIQFFIMAAIPDVPESIVYHQQRSEYLNNKIIDQVADDIIDTKAMVQKHLPISTYPTGAADVNTYMRDSQGGRSPLHN